MKIVVIGGSGPIGRELVKRLRDDGHDPLGGISRLGQRHPHR
jgi:nucleoside-diphosphate-sugar epimerase